MSVFAIGDTQGCFNELQLLLEKINFNPKKDRLWFAGDLVNRGPQSLATLRFIKNLGSQHRVVLGNHDFHLLAVASGARKLQAGDTILEILQASDCDELLHWLRQQPLFHFDEQLNCAMVHAGLIPQWNFQTAIARSQEVEKILQGDHYKDLLANAFGNEPNCWHDALHGWDRVRVIINTFTRLRICNQDGKMNLNYKGALGSEPPPFQPWPNVYNKRQALKATIVFGHWAALNGKVDVPDIFALDTGCVWGGKLRALRLDDKRIFEVASLQTKRR